MVNGLIDLLWMQMLFPSKKNYLMTQDVIDVSHTCCGLALCVDDLCNQIRLVHFLDRLIFKQINIANLLLILV